MKRATKQQDLSDLLAAAEEEVRRLTDALHRLENENEELKRRKGSADEQASLYMSMYSQVNTLAAERGKVISILVQRINELESK